MDRALLTQELSQLKHALEMLQMDKDRAVELLREQLEDVRASLKAAKMCEATKYGTSNQAAERIALLEADRRMLTHELSGLREWLESN